MIANWAAFPEYILFGAMGAASFEVIQNYQLKGKKDFEQYKEIITSWIYWVKFCLFLLGCGFIAWAMHENNPNAIA
jgi:hypothetical protein